jgi:hypothetical protein
LRAKFPTSAAKISVNFLITLRQRVSLSLRAASIMCFDVI